MKRRGKKIGLIGPIGILVLHPLPVQAHLNTTGLGPVYDGLLHFVLSPEDFVRRWPWHCTEVCAALLTAGAPYSPCLLRGWQQASSA